MTREFRGLPATWLGPTWSCDIGEVTRDKMIHTSLPRRNNNFEGQTKRICHLLRDMVSLRRHSSLVTIQKNYHLCLQANSVFLLHVLEADKTTKVIYLKTQRVQGELMVLGNF